MAERIINANLNEQELLSLEFALASYYNEKKRVSKKCKTEQGKAATEYVCNNVPSLINKLGLGYCIDQND